MNIIDIIDIYGVTKRAVPAHIYRESSISYEELKLQSDALANYIIDKFGHDKTPIVVFGHKQHEMLISFIACVKAGHSYIPIDSSLPAERVRDILESSKTKIILDVTGVENALDNEIVVSLEEIRTIIKENSGKAPDRDYQVKTEDVFYIIYTSGSTGKPKGVQITLGCLESFIKWGLSLCKLSDDRQYTFMNQAPFSFDLSVMDLYLSLASGSTLYSIDKSMIGNLKELFEYLGKSSINIWVSTPSFADMCLADSKFSRELLPGLELMLFCGETLTNSCVEKLLARFESTKVVNLYGPTEATVAITAVEISKSVCENIKPLPVGSVKEDCRILILDDKGNELPEGQKGEIVIAGDSVSIGYYNNSEMTEKAFYRMYIDGKEVRCYKTGDEGYLKEGMLYYSGRMDFQVKLNGFRIEIEDIENNLRKVSIIENCVVLPVIKENKIQYLAAFVTLNRTIDEKELKISMMIKEELKKLIPDYMIPRKISIKSALPMTTNGKVNRKELMEEMK